MNTIQPRQISVIEPIGAAIEKTKQILFRPFDIGKWFTIGFCAFLATLGSGGIPNSGGGGGHSSGGQTQDFHREINNIKDALLDNLPIVVIVAAVAFLLILAISLVLAWLSSRGQFMFLHCVAQNKGEVAVPWKRYAQQANSLFLFKLLVGFAGTIAVIICLIPLGVIGFSFTKTGMAGFAMMNLVWIGLLAFCIITLAMTIAGIKLLTEDFVIPIMSLRGCTVTEGWKEFWNILMSNKGPFTLYLLFLFVIGLATGMIILIAVLATCCCAGCIMAIPYIGTVLLLPILVWRRSYSLCYLAQYGSQFDVFGSVPDPVVVPTTLIPPLSPETNS